MDTVLVNAADWQTPDGVDVPDGWQIANAPRPIAGPVTWTGEFRHGVFYAAAPETHPTWGADDAWPVEFITNGEIRDRVLAKFAEYGYADEDEAGVTIAEQAECMRLPWHEDGERF